MYRERQAEGANEKAILSAVLAVLWLPAQAPAQDLDFPDCGINTTMENWRPLAMQGDVDAQYCLGVQSIGAAPKNSFDFLLGLASLTSAAEQGNVFAQLYLFELYSEGRFVQRDVIKSDKWGQRAADKGNADIQFALGLAAGWGWGKQSAERGLKYYLLAARQGHSPSQLTVGYAYLQDLGAESRDLVTGYMWVKIAHINYAEEKQRAPIEELGRLGTDITPEEISEAERRVLVCMETDYQTC